MANKKETKVKDKTRNTSENIGDSSLEKVVASYRNGDSQFMWWTVFLMILALTFMTRFHKVSEPDHVVWDETHFGKFASWYINRTFFFDVHPPLGKMLIGAFGYLTGYDGMFPFVKPGDKYDGVSYLGMRVCCTAMGASLVPFSFVTVWEMTRSLPAATLASSFILFDIGFLTLNQYILLDPILLFFIMGSVMGYSVFKSHSDRSFSPSWWFWLHFTGLMLSGSVSVKFVGVFVVIYVGINTIHDLWEIYGDLGNSMVTVMKHFAARALGLIAFPTFLYLVYFYIHLAVLTKSGNGDGFYSSAFQSQLEGNSLYNASMPLELAYGAEFTLKNARTGGGYLHSHIHLYPENVGARQQQITTYSHKDFNNKWFVKQWNEEPGDWEDDGPIDIVKNGDLIRLEHVPTGRNLHSHREPAPVTSRHFQVTGYGENGLGDINDVWRVEIVNGAEGEPVKTVVSKFKLIHYLVGCALLSHNKQLPKWGFEQMEVTCSPNIHDPDCIWNIEDNVYPKLPNTSFEIYAPNFLEKFIESHTVMFQGNSGLKPKEGEVTSQPWQWPINYRGQHFSAGNVRIYLLGNPIIMWSNLAAMMVYVVLRFTQEFSNKRGYYIDPGVKGHQPTSVEDGDEDDITVLLTGNIYTGRCLFFERGQWFSAIEGFKVYLLGNPIIWWGNIAVMAVFVLIYFVNAFRTQRGYQEEPQTKKRREATLTACGWLALAWALHYLPFYFMGRILYFHHYFPALLFSSMLTGVVLEYILDSLIKLVPRPLSPIVYPTLSGLIYSSLIYSFYIFSPLAYGMFESNSQADNSTVHGLKWLDTWEF